MLPLVYIIDDNMVSEFATRMAIKQSGMPCTLVSFDNPEAGLLAFKESIDRKYAIPELILLDLKMPHMDGWQFLEKLSEIGITAQQSMIYLVSSYADSKVRKRAEQHALLGGYFERPLSSQNISSIFSGLAI